MKLKRTKIVPFLVIPIWNSLSNHVFPVRSTFLLQQCHFGPKFRVKGVAHTNHSSYQKTKINCLLFGVRMLTAFNSLPQSTHFLLQQCHFGPKFQVKGVAHTNHSSYQKTKINCLLFGVRMLTAFNSLPQSTHFSES